MENRTQLIKKLLPGFIPLFVFIAADEIWGTKVGLFVAIATGVAELAWIALKEKRFEKFVLFDTLLLVVLGGISIWLDNDIFFKLKPGLVELILVAVIGISAFSSVNIIGLMGQRYLKGTELNESHLVQMRKTMKPLFFIFTVHTLLVFYAAFYLSSEAWAFISGGLFYLIFGFYFVYEFLRQRRIKKSWAKEEWVPLVDDQGKVLGKAPRSQVHNGSKLLHPVVHLHVINSKSELLLQKRPMNKLIQPGKWDTAVGGHISAGETLEEALKKEAAEEIGLKSFSAKLCQVYKWESEVEAELVYMFTSNDTHNIGIQSDEVQELRFWPASEIQEAIREKIVTPNFVVEFKLLKDLKLI